MSDNGSLVSDDEGYSVSEERVGELDVLLSTDMAVWECFFSEFVCFSLAVLSRY